jgi:hypothetical protein
MLEVRAIFSAIPLVCGHEDGREGDDALLSVSLRFYEVGTASLEDRVASTERRQATSITGSSNGDASTYGTDAALGAGRAERRQGTNLFSSPRQRYS